MSSNPHRDRDVPSAQIAVDRVNPSLYIPHLVQACKSSRINHFQHNRSAVWHFGCTGWARESARTLQQRDSVTEPGTRRQTWPRKIVDLRRWIAPSSARLQAKAEKQRIRKAPRTSGRVRRHGTPAAKAASRVTSGVENSAAGRVLKTDAAPNHQARRPRRRTSRQGGGTVNRSHAGTPGRGFRCRAPRHSCLATSVARLVTFVPHVRCAPTSHLQLDRDKSLGYTIGFP